MRRTENLLGKNLSFPTRISVPYFVLNSSYFSLFQMGMPVLMTNRIKQKNHRFSVVCFDFIWWR